MKAKTLIVVLVAMVLAGLSVVSAQKDDPPPRQPPRQSPAPTTGRAGATTRRGRPHSYRGSGGSRRPLSEERVAELLEGIKKDRPEMHEKLIQLRKSDPRAFTESLRRIDYYVRRWESQPPEVREIYTRLRKNGFEVMRLSRAYRSETDASKKAEIRQKIKALAASRFDDEQKLKEYRLQQLAKQLKELEEEVAERAGQREKHIDRSVERLLKPRRRE